MNLQPYRVLLATAYPPVSAVLRRLITSLHSMAQVVTVTDGQVALRTFRTSGADLIFADYNLPALSGLNLVRTIRLDDPLVPFVMLSVDPQRQQPSLSAGATHFVVKPFAVTTIEELLKELLPQQARAYGATW
jgi:CheY-like chemotaxis protein